MAAEPQSTDRILAQICALVNSRKWPVHVGKLRVTASGSVQGNNLDIFVEGEYGNGYDYRVNADWNPERGASYLGLTRTVGGLSRPIADFAEADIQNARKGLKKILNAVMINATMRYKDLLRKIAIEKATKVRTPPVPPVRGHKAAYVHKENRR